MAELRMLLLIYFFSLITINDGEMCDYSTFKAKLADNNLQKDKSQIRGKNIVNEEQCFFAACGTDCKSEIACVAYYKEATHKRIIGICYRYNNQQAAYDAVKGGKMRTRKRSKIILRASPRDTLMPTPSGFWLFDSVSRGKNLGMKGSSLDCNIYRNPSLFKWDVVGPKRKRKSNLRFVNPPGTRETFCIIKLYDEKKNLILDVEKPLTISFWLKTNNNKHIQMPILEGRGLYTFDLWLYPSNDLDQLALCPMDNSPYSQKQIYITEKNATDIAGWRHMAVVFRHSGSVAFYLNGNIWPHKNPRKTINGAWQPHSFHVFNFGYYDAPFEGSLACLLYFENMALDQATIQRIMKNCP